MSSELMSDFALQMLAAFVIFSIGYVALFSSLVVCLLVTKGLYKGAEGIWNYAVRTASKKTLASDLESPARVDRGIVIQG
jgi:hypothetical protein